VDDIRGRLEVLWWGFVLVAAVGGFVWYYAVGTFGVVGTIVLVLSALSLLIGTAGGIGHARHSLQQRHVEADTTPSILSPAPEAAPPPLEASPAPEAEEERAFIDVTPAYLVGLSKVTPTYRRNR
jgi:hypothetical protein